MPVNFPCPNPDCNATYNVAEENLGKFGRCKKCGTRFALVPGTRVDWPGSKANLDTFPMMDNPDEAPLPTEVGRYQVRKRLGRGGMGTVYLALDPKLEREVALKIPHPQQSRDATSRERFLREARAVARFHHENFCPIFDIDEVEGTPFLVMAYIDGQTLEKSIEPGVPWEARKAAEIVRQLAVALAEAHRQKIVHRDLKPANVMVDTKGRLILMDFGLARHFDSSDPSFTAAGSILGTPAYMPPEQAEGDLKAIGPRSDIYSLGVILYELLGGRRPFEGASSRVLAQILMIDPPPPSSYGIAIEPAIEAICLKAMAKKIEDRFASMDEFAEALKGQITEPQETELEGSRKSLTKPAKSGKRTTKSDVSRPGPSTIPSIEKRHPRDLVGNSAPNPETLDRPTQPQGQIKAKDTELASGKTSKPISIWARMAAMMLLVLGGTTLVIWQTQMSNENHKKEFARLYEEAKRAEISDREPESLKKLSDIARTAEEFEMVDKLKTRRDQVSGKKTRTPSGEAEAYRWIMTIDKAIDDGRLDEARRYLDRLKGSLSRSPSGQLSEVLGRITLKLEGAERLAKPQVPASHDSTALTSSKFPVLERSGLTLFQSWTPRIGKEIKSFKLIGAHDKKPPKLEANSLNKEISAWVLKCDPGAGDSTKSIGVFAELPEKTPSERIKLGTFSAKGQSIQFIPDPALIQPKSPDASTYLSAMDALEGLKSCVLEVTLEGERIYCLLKPFPTLGEARFRLARSFDPRKINFEEHNGIKYLQLQVEIGKEQGHGQLQPYLDHFTLKGSPLLNEFNPSFATTLKGKVIGEFPGLQTMSGKTFQIEVQARHSYQGIPQDEETHFINMSIKYWPEDLWREGWKNTSEGEKKAFEQKLKRYKDGEPDSVPDFKMVVEKGAETLQRSLEKLYTDACMNIERKYAKADRIQDSQYKADLQGIKQLKMDEDMKLRHNTGIAIGFLTALFSAEIKFNLVVEIDSQPFYLLKSN